MDTGLPSSSMQPLPSATRGAVHGIATGVVSPSRDSTLVLLGNYKEEHLQEAVSEFLDAVSTYAKTFVWFHCPNGGVRNKRVATKLKRHGVKRGIPDCILFCMDGRVISIELKRDASLSDDQKSWRDNIVALGHTFHVVKEKTPELAVRRVEEILRKERLLT
jgi:hypothetical protein